MTYPFAPPGQDSPSAALFSLRGRTAFVTGAAGHLGSATARAFVEAGARVILHGRRAAPLQRFAEELGSAGHASELACFDVRDYAAMRMFFAEEAAAGRRLDILVHNAYTGRPTPWRGAHEEDFETAFQSGPTAAFELVKAAEPLLARAARATGQASVIFISSMYGHVSPDPRLYGDSGLDSPPHYGAAKGALLQLTRYLACHLAPQGIRVNAVSPGPFPKAEIQTRDPAFLKRLEEKVPMGRVGRAGEIAGPLLFLASEASSYVTGVNLAVDGGWTAW
ncbi:MAG: SDR family oxidoreductase [Alphaproteobacteria bacterium]|nr:SDR family oxidoreductase [Alphaproteobacteria bacterium]